MGLGVDLLQWLGLERTGEDRQVLDAVADVLDRLAPDRARYVAAFAYLLGRVAGADLTVTDDERRIMGTFVSQEAGLSASEAATVVALAIAETHQYGGTHNLLVTREFARHASPEERLGLLRCLFAVSAADADVTVREDNEVRIITRELKIEHADFVRARDEVRQHLAVLRR